MEMTLDRDPLVGEGAVLYLAPDRTCLQGANLDEVKRKDFLLCSDREAVRTNSADDNREGRVIRSVKYLGHLTKLSKKWANRLLNVSVASGPLDNP